MLNLGKFKQHLKQKTTNLTNICATSKFCSFEATNQFANNGTKGLPIATHLLPIGL